jgi:hypothetical protein
MIDLAKLASGAGFEFTESKIAPSLKGHSR